MGARKHNSAEKRKEALKSVSFAKLNGVPSSPRKMRYVVDMGSWHGGKPCTWCTQIL